MLTTIDVLGASAVGPHLAVGIYSHKEPYKFTGADFRYNQATDCWHFLFFAEEGDVVEINVDPKEGNGPLYFLLLVSDKEESRGACIFSRGSGDDAWSICVGPYLELKEVIDTSNTAAYVKRVMAYLQKPLPDVGGAEDKDVKDNPNLIIKQLFEDPDLLSFVTARGIMEGHSGLHFES